VDELADKYPQHRFAAENHIRCLPHVLNIAVQAAYIKIDASLEKVNHYITAILSEITRSIRSVKWSSSSRIHLKPRRGLKEFFSPTASNPKQYCWMLKQDGVQHF
jgi:hypothetical protein